MPVDPYTGEVLPYDGPWPPPEWDDPLALPPVMPDAPAVAVAPEAAQARAAADALFADKPQVDVEMGDAIPEADPQALAFDVEMGAPVIEPEAPPLDVAPDAQPDAVTGGQLPEPQPAAPPAPALLTNPKNREQAEKEARRAEIEAMSSGDLALAEFDAQQAAEAEAAPRRMEALKAEHDAAREAEQEYRAAMDRFAQERAEINAERERLANEKVDPDGWRNSRGLFGTIRAIALGVVGGLVQSRQGGANQGLQIIQNEIERHIQAQRENIANRRALLGERRLTLADSEAEAAAMFRQEQAFREAALQRAFDDIEADKAQFDPFGTAVRKRTQLQQQIAAQIAKSQQDADREMQDRQIKVGEYNLKVSAENRAIAKQNAELQRRAAGGVGSGSAAKQKRTSKEWSETFGIPIPDDGRLRDEKEITQFMNTLGKADQLKKAKQEREDFERTNKVKGPQGDLRTSEGRIYVPPTDVSKEIRQHMNATTQLISMLDEVDAIRSRVGGESKWGNSADFQRLETLQENIVKVAKGGTEGMSSDADMARLAASMGAKDLTSFRSQAARIKQARARLVEAMNGELYNVGNYDGDPIQWPNTQSSGTTKKTAKEKAAADIIDSDAGNDPSRVPGVVAATGPVGYSAKAIDWLIGKAEGKESATPEETKKMRSFLKLALEGDQASIQALRDISEKSNSEEFRRWAHNALKTIGFVRPTAEAKARSKERDEEEAFLKEGE